VDETALQMMDKLCVVTLQPFAATRAEKIDIPRHVTDADPASRLQPEQSNDLSQSKNPNANVLSGLGSIEKQH
jgi:hypothetical protein